MKKIFIVLGVIFLSSTRTSFAQYPYNPSVMVQGEYFIPGYGWTTLGGTRDFGAEYYGNRSFVRQGGVYNQYYGNTQYPSSRIRIGPYPNTDRFARSRQNDIRQNFTGSHRR